MERNCNRTTGNLQDIGDSLLYFFLMYTTTPILSLPRYTTNGIKRWLTLSYTYSIIIIESEDT